MRSVLLQCTNRSYTHKAKVTKYSRGSNDVQKVKIDPNDESHLQRRLFVSNIPLDATWKDLKDHFRVAGATFVSISKDPVTGKSKGCGIVQFDDESIIDDAITRMHGTKLLGSYIGVKRDLKWGGSTSRNSNPVFERDQRITERTTHSNKAAPQQKSKDYWNEIHDAQPSTSTRSNRPAADNTVPKRRDSNHEVASNWNSASDGRPASVSANKVTIKGATRSIQRDPRDEVYIAESELARIEALLAKREEHRVNKNFESADAIQVTLRNTHRVQCEDTDGLWRILPPVKSNGDIRRDNMRMGGRPSNRSRTEY